MTLKQAAFLVTGVGILFWGSLTLVLWFVLK